MARLLKKRTHATGSVPGTPVFVGEQKEQSVNLRLIDYDEPSIKEISLKSIDEIIEYLKTPSISWVNIDGLHDTELIKKTGELFNLHPLIIEDITNTDQRSKIEEYDNCILIIAKMLFHDKDKGIISEQFSLVLGSNYVLTFQERIGHVFDPVRERIRKSMGRVRKMGADYLAYILLDTIIDNYFVLLEKMGEQIEDMELDLTSSVKPDFLHDLNYFKREINYIQKMVRPIRDSISKMARMDSDFLSDSISIYLKDLEDLIIQVYDAVESYRELLVDQWDIYNTHISNKLNDIIKVLTIFSVIFIPLTFVAGIYGTNFEYLPELHFRYSYFIFWLALITIAVSMLYFFKRKNWL